MSLDSTLDRSNIRNIIMKRDLANFKKIKCERCGAEAIVNTGIILTSDPPQYNVDCPNCGRIYMFCDKVKNQLL